MNDTPRTERIYFGRRSAFSTPKPQPSSPRGRLMVLQTLNCESVRHREESQSRQHDVLRDRLLRPCLHLIRCPRTSAPAFLKCRKSQASFPTSFSCLPTGQRNSAPLWPTTTP